MMPMPITYYNLKMFAMLMSDIHYSRTSQKTTYCFQQKSENSKG